MGSIRINLAGLASFLLSVAAATAQENVQTNENGIVATIGPARVEIAPAAAGTFRLSVGYDGAAPAQSSFLAPVDRSSRVGWHAARDGAFVGVRTEAGRLLVNPHTGEWTLENAKGEPVIPKGNIGTLETVTNAPGSRVTIALGAAAKKFTGVYGCGNEHATLAQTESRTHVDNGIASVPYYWSPGGYCVLAIGADDNRPATWRAAANTGAITWSVPGKSGDLYLAPAETLREATMHYADWAGHPPVPPRWAFGYLQSRWGWKNRAYIEDTLKQFIDKKIPVDAFIYDFEWYTTMPDYEVPAPGLANFSDFNWNTNLFPEPAQQIADYKSNGVHCVVIRKPRLGNATNLAFIRAQGWDLAGIDPKRADKFDSRDVNYRNPDFRRWYVERTTNLLAQGIDGWWNDEGEASYTTYYYWNLAEQEVLDQTAPDRRLWTINRAFSPGVQRLGAGAWTGDIRTSWKTLLNTPTSLLNWGLAGMAYSGCDIGGYDGPEPDGEMLSRWMEAGVFFPIMRSHSAHERIPRFPWLRGPEAESAIRKAIELRYRLFPYYYSLAHEAQATGLPIMRPLIMEFPRDREAANISDQWLMGESLMAAPVLQAGGERSVYFPAGSWRQFDTNTVMPGTRTGRVRAALDEIPLYVRGGSILPLAPPIQHLSDLPGGSLELQVYPGKDAAFTMVEDDGATTAYLTGGTRRTTFRWDDGAHRLTWRIDGPYAGKDIFTMMRVVVLDKSGGNAVETPLTAEGSVVVK